MIMKECMLPEWPKTKKQGPKAITSNQYKKVDLKTWVGISKWWVPLHYTHKNLKGKIKYLIIIQEVIRQAIINLHWMLVWYIAIKFKRKPTCMELRNQEKAYMIKICIHLHIHKKLSWHWDYLATKKMKHLNRL